MSVGKNISRPPNTKKQGISVFGFERTARAQGCEGTYVN